jgi:hypothetical protein
VVRSGAGTGEVRKKKAGSVISTLHLVDFEQGRTRSAAPQRFRSPFIELIAEHLREKVERKGSEDGCLQIIQASELSRPWVGKSFSAAILRWRCLKRSRVSLTIQGGAAMNRGGTGSNLRCIRQNLVKGF